jgi:hypothetical protein
MEQRIRALERESDLFFIENGELEWCDRGFTIDNRHSMNPHSAILALGIPPMSQPLAEQLDNVRFERIRSKRMTGGDPNEQLDIVHLVHLVWYRDLSAVIFITDVDKQYIVHVHDKNKATLLRRNEFVDAQHYILMNGKTNQCSPIHPMNYEL